MQSVRADTDTTSFEIQPLTPDRWDDLETLFGPRGAYGGCWCMFWRVTRAEFGRQCAHNGAGNKAAFQAVVANGDAPGLLVYAEGKPVGWCSVAPREVYGALERSPKRRRIDDQPVWSITCFYVADGWRRKGVNSALVQGAIAYVKREGGTMLEAYPRLNAPGMTQPSDEGAFMGLSEVFRAAGFVEVARPAKSRFVIMRYAIQ